MKRKSKIFVNTAYPVIEQEINNFLKANDDNDNFKILSVTQTEGNYISVLIIYTY